MPIALFIPIGISVILRAALPRPGAPRFHIYFECPHCHQMISLARERRGLTSWCPRCTEILTVPSTSASDEPPEAQRIEPDVPPETERKKPDVREGLVKHVSRTSALVHGLTRVWDVARFLVCHVEFQEPDEETATVTGVLQDRLGRIPEVGDALLIGPDLHLEVKEADGRRAVRVLARNVGTAN